VVSVVVAAYNEAAHVGRLLASLRDQSLPALEVVVIDDGSTDGTAEIAARAGATVIRTTHRGPARARNLGAERARGDILVFLDGDMACGEDFLRRLVEPILAGAVGAFTRDIWLGNPDERWARAYAVIRRQPFPRVLPADFPDRWTNFRAVRRDRFLSVGGYDDVGYGEDMTLAPKLREEAAVAPGARCLHFNPATISEIFENGRWIGRGHNIDLLPRRWRANLPPRILARAYREIRAGHGLSILPARLTYHSGVLVGMIRRAFLPDRHWK
jgi:glycosyltransferase involved in cell wall biosynthesis